MIPFGDRHRRRMIAEFVAQYQRERNHQGLGNELIEGVSVGQKILAAFGDASGSAGCSVITRALSSGARRSTRRLGSRMRHYAVGVNDSVVS